MIDLLFDFFRICSESANVFVEWFSQPLLESLELPSGLESLISDAVSLVGLNINDITPLWAFGVGLFIVLTLNIVKWAIGFLP